MDEFLRGTDPVVEILDIVLFTDNSSVYVVGGSDYVSTQKDATVLKYDLAGNSTFTKHYNGEEVIFSETARSIVIDSNDRSYVGVTLIVKIITVISI